MKQRLINILTKYSVKVDEAQTTNSIYFTMLNGVKVRVSDHHSTYPDCDLAIDTPRNMVAYTIYPVRVPAKFTYQTIDVESIYSYISYFAMIAPCFKSAQGSKKKKQEIEEVEKTPSNTEISEKLMKKINALPEGAKKEMILNFIKDFRLNDMSCKVGELVRRKASKGKELIDKWTKQ
jgi:hypothetical protein